MEEPADCHCGEMLHNIYRRSIRSTYIVTGRRSTSGQYIRCIWYYETISWDFGRVVEGKHRCNASSSTARHLGIANNSRSIEI